MKRLFLGVLAVFLALAVSVTGQQLSPSIDKMMAEYYAKIGGNTAVQALAQAKPSMVDLIPGNMDYPAKSATVSVSAGKFFFAGWTVNCWTSQQPVPYGNGPAVTLYYSEPAGWPPLSGTHTLKVLGRDGQGQYGGGLEVYWRGHRPDVALNPGLVCPGATTLSDYFGVAIYSRVPVPTGDRLWIVEIVDPGVVVGAGYHQLRLNVVP